MLVVLRQWIRPSDINVGPERRYSHYSCGIRIDQTKDVRDAVVIESILFCKSQTSRPSKCNIVQPAVPLVKALLPFVLAESIHGFQQQYPQLRNARGFVPRL